MNQNKNVAITGASGFVGRYLIASKPEDVNVLALIRKNSTTFFSSECLSEKTDYSVSQLCELFSNVGTVIHLAARRPASFCSSKEGYSNYQLDAAVLEAAYQSGVKDFIYASSRSVYETGHIPWKESSAVVAEEGSYASAKLLAERLAAEYSKKGLNVSCLRLSQVLGIGEYQRSAVNVFLQKSLKNEAISISVKGKNFREYIYIKDLADAIWKVFSAGCVPGIFNLGSGFGCSIQELAEIFSEVFGSPSPVFEGKLQLLDERSLMNSEKFYNAYSWLPRWTIRSAVIDMMKDAENGF